MNFRDRPAAVWALPLAMLVLALLILGADVGGLASEFRGVLFDGYQKVAPRPYQDTRARAGLGVRVLDVDQPSLDRFGPWPWPHAVLAKLAGELKTAGARIVVYDFPLDQTDQGSPKRLLALVPTNGSFDAARAALSQMPSPDEALGQAMRDTKSVVGFNADATDTLRPPELKPHVTVLGTRAPYSVLPDFGSAIAPIGDVGNSAAGIGALNVLPDPDGKLRRMALLFRVGGAVAPSLDLETFRVAQDLGSVSIKSDEGESALFGRAAGIESVLGPSGDVPTAPDGSVWIAYSRAGAVRSISAAELDSGAVPVDTLKDQIVIIGAPNDRVATPGGMRSVADVHAEVLENLLLGAALRRPALASLAELICLGIIGLAIAILFARFGVVWAGLFTGAAILAAFYVSWHLYAANHVLFDALGPSMGFAAIFAVGAAARMIEIAASRARLRTAFADALPYAAIEVIARKPQLLRLEGETRTVTYLACGIRGFAQLASVFRDDPAAFTRLVQRALTPLMDEALAHGGTIDRLTSDGFTAFWNAPLDDPEHAIHACEAASRMTEVMARVNDTITHERRIDGVALSPVEIGIGLSTGPAIAGGFRAHGRTAYSVNGDCTITAARVQSLSGQYGPAVIVSETTRKASERGFAFLEVDYIACGAHDEPIKLYAMLGNPVVRASPKFRALMTFHDHIFDSLRHKQWDKARALIEQCRKLSGASQKLYDLHLARVAYFESNPPGADWDGAFRPILR
jgi:adenylate cyclase